MKHFFWNRPVDKGAMKKLIAWFLITYGRNRTLAMLEALKWTGFQYATRAGISLSIEDLKVPPTKPQLLIEAEHQMATTESRYRDGKITVVERFQQVIDTWNGTSEILKDNALQNFLETDPLNPVYMMALSGARGNVSQVRQLVGMRGLMADPQGQILDFPIRSNFREGLTVTEYIISCYGARKGLVDTALKTANSGYLTRRLADVAQDFLIRQEDCGTKRGLRLMAMQDNTGKILVPLQDRMVGRVLAAQIDDPDGQLVGARNEAISKDLASRIIKVRDKAVLVRSPLRCRLRRSVCRLCYGWAMSGEHLVELGEAVGILAAQSIGEPGTQLTMRTFHTGGVFAGSVAEQIRSPSNGFITYPKPMRGKLMRTRHGEYALVTNQSGVLRIHQEDSMQPGGLESGGQDVHIPEGAIILVQHGEPIRTHQLLAEIPANQKVDVEKVKVEKVITTKTDGEVRFSDLVLRKMQAQQGGLVWVLQGHLFRPATPCNFFAEPGDFAEVNVDLARYMVLNSIEGNIEYESNNLNLSIPWGELPINKVAATLKEGKIDYRLQTNSKEYLNTKVKQPLRSSTSLYWHKELYQTQTGGIAHYDQFDEFNSILWIPQEVHVFSNSGLWDLEGPICKNLKLCVEDGEFIEAGQLLVGFNPESSHAENSLLDQSRFKAQISGLVQIKKQGIDNLIITIKPGYLCEVDNSNNLLSGLIPAGSQIHESISCINQTVYVELINWQPKKKKSLWQLHGSCEPRLGQKMFIRPVVIYPIYSEKFLFVSKINQPSQIKPLFKNRPLPLPGGEWQLDQICNLTIGKLFLSSTNLLEISLDSISYSPSKPTQTIKVTPYQSSLALQGIVNFKTSLDEPLFTPNSLTPVYGGLGEQKMVSPADLEFHTIQGSQQVVWNYPDDYITLEIGKSDLQVKLNDLICEGQTIADNLISSHAGQVVEIESDRIKLRLAQPYRIAQGAQLEVMDRDLVSRGQAMFTLVYQEVKTEDIVQGLPKVEELLEARKTKGFNLIPRNPHTQLEGFFQLFTYKFNPGYGARKSLEVLQERLVDGVQQVYRSQGVEIADKHVEVIVRQMTSKVRVVEGGDTPFLPGDIVDLHQIELMNRYAIPRAIYEPIVIGITRAALTTDSFISAASFQETTRVLTQASIEAKQDWLRGLKENVILGRLIPAGTAFDPIARLEEQSQKTNDLILNAQRPGFGAFNEPNQQFLLLALGQEATDLPVLDMIVLAEDPVLLQVDR